MGARGGRGQADGGAFRTDALALKGALTAVGERLFYTANAAALSPPHGLAFFQEVDHGPGGWGLTVRPTDETAGGIEEDAACHYFLEGDATRIGRLRYSIDVVVVHAGR